MLYLKMVTINREKTLNIILPNTNKALQTLLKESSKGDLEKLSLNKDLNSIMNALLKQSANDATQDNKLLDLLKNNPTLKELGKVTTTLNELLNRLKQEKKPLQFEKILTASLEDIKNIDEKSLKTKIENSGLFVENKLKNLQTPKQELHTLLHKLSTTLEDTKLPNLKTVQVALKELLQSDTFQSKSENLHLTKKVATLLEHFQERINSSVDKSISPKDILFSKETQKLLSKIEILNKPEQLTIQTKIKELFSQDFKVLLHQAHEEISASSSPNKQELLKHIDKLSLQIDYHQLVSHLSHSTSLYIPYTWDALEDGTISMKKQNSEKFFTDINLQLKEYGELKLRLGLFEKNQLNINITTQNNRLKYMMQKTLPLLKKQLFDAGIYPKEIRFIDEKQNLYSDTNTELAVGFEVKA